MIVKHAYFAELGDGDKFHVVKDGKTYEIFLIWFIPTDPEDYYYGYELDANGDIVPDLDPRIMKHTTASPLVMSPGPNTTTPIATITATVDALNDGDDLSALNATLATTTDNTGIPNLPTLP